jgi:hypothetical protein
VRLVNLDCLHAIFISGPVQGYHFVFGSRSSRGRLKKYKIEYYDVCCILRLKCLQKNSLGFISPIKCILSVQKIRPELGGQKNRI